LMVTVLQIVCVKKFDGNREMLWCQHQIFSFQNTQGVSIKCPESHQMSYRGQFILCTESLHARDRWTLQV
jgi:hypothetical protein